MLVETNSFGGSPLTLGEFDLSERAFEINRLAAALAREATEKLAGDDRCRYVIGAIGPGTRLPSLGHVSYQDLEDGFAVQTAGLLAGSADVILCETCQDPLQVKAAVNGAKRAMVDAGARRPLMVHVTVETTGTMLVGTDIAAATAIIDALDVDVLRPELRNRAAGDGGASALSLRELAGVDLGAAQCRPARTGGWPDPLPSWPERARRLAGALHHRGRSERHWRLLRHRDRAYPGLRFHAQQARRR